MPLRFVAVLLLALGLGFALCYKLFQLEAAGIENRLRDRETLRLAAFEQVLQSDLLAITYDLRGLIEGDALQAYLAHGIESDLTRAATRAAFFTRLHRQYHALRFLDRSGRELFRTAPGGGVVSAADLRSEAGTTLYRATQEIARNTLFISAFASDSGAASLSPSPAIVHLAMPVFDRTGTRRGTYVIDVLGAEIFADFQRIAPTLHHRLRLLDATGQWLIGERPELEGGSVLPARAVHALPRTAPDLWAAILASPQGQRPLDGGLFTWRRIQLRDFAAHELSTVTTEEPFLVFASVVSAREWDEPFALTRRIFALSLPTLLLLILCCAWLLRSLQRSLHSLRRSEQNLAVTLDSIGDGVLATDRSGHLTRMNAVAEQLTGWTFATARGRLLAEIFPLVQSETRQALALPFESALTTGQPQALPPHSRLLARDGTSVPVGGTTAPIREPDGTFSGIVLVFRDTSTALAWAEMQTRLAAIVESSEDAILTKRLDGIITSWNPAATRMFGYTAAEAIGQPVALLVPPERHAEETDLLDRLAAGHFAQIETQRLRRDQTLVDVSITLSPLKDPGGRIIGASSILRDITRWKQATELLRKSAAQIHDLYNSAPCGYHSLDADGRIIAINDTELAWLGYRREEVVGRLHLLDLLTEESRTRFHATFPRFKRDGAVQGLELRFVRRDGSILHALVNATGSFDPAGRFVASRSSLFDITARKAAEEELNGFFELSLDFLCISSSDGFFRRVSPAVTDMLGWTVEEFLARPYLDFVHPDDIEATLRAVDQQVRHGEKVFHFENRYRHKDGTWRILSWRSIPQPHGLMYATARDVTRQHQDAENLRQLHANLARHAAQLEVANQELESFSYSVSHDLRAPLRHIRGYVEMLDRESHGHLSEKGAHYLHVITDAAREMGELIDDLLLFSRMGRAELQQTEIDLRPLIADTRRTLELANPGRPIEWTIAPLPLVQGDVAMLRVVLVNLLGNAVKYTRPRQPARIEIGCAGEENHRHIFFVRDNGAGFDMRYADKLFGVFQRLHRAEEFEGTGIGLASVRRIITRHGGRTWAEGHLGTGATFYFTLAPATPPAPSLQS